MIIICSFLIKQNFAPTNRCYEVKFLYVVLLYLLKIYKISTEDVPIFFHPAFPDGTFVKTRD